MVLKQGKSLLPKNTNIIPSPRNIHASNIEKQIRKIIKKNKDTLLRHGSLRLKLERAGLSKQPFPSSSSILFEFSLPLFPATQLCAWISLEYE